jgi:hypothetical protein
MANQACSAKLREADPLSEIGFVLPKRPQR